MLEFITLVGKEAKTYINQLASYRISYFREFPYLYDGNLDYEEKYLGSFFNNDNAVLFVVKDQDKVIALSTAIPLASDYEIVQNTQEVFEKNGLNVDEFYYFGEIIVLPEYRKKGIATSIFKKQEELAKTLGYKWTCFLVVVREDDHSLRPKDYLATDILWQKLGYKKADILVDFEWPTIQINGESANESNQMVYWIKSNK